MHRLLGGVALGLCLFVSRDAGAIAACGGGSGWALASGSTVTSRPHLVYYFGANLGARHPTVAATLDGKPVKATVSFTQAAPYQLATVVVDSDRAGKLAITWAPDKDNWHPANGNFVIDPKLAVGKEAKGTASRFHQAFEHTSVHELEDGLEVTVDQPAIAFTAKWRLDDKAQWATIDLTAVTVGGHQVARLGDLGCSSNFQTAILERGIDLELTATLVDGSTVKVTGVPAHYTLPKLPANAPVSRP